MWASSGTSNITAWTGKSPIQAQFYTNFNQIPLQSLPGSVRRINLLTRTEVEPLSLASAVRGQVAALNKDQAVFNVRTMDQILAQSVALGASRCCC